MGVLSKILRKASKHYDKIAGTLYMPTNKEGKKCGVCFLGAIALIGRPDRFVPDPTRLNGIRDKTTGASASYNDILRAVGVPANMLHRRYEVMRRNGKIISASSLSGFIPDLNDSTDCTFEQAAWILDNRGL